MKKISALLLAVSLLLSAAACGASGKQEDNGSDGQTETENVVFKYGTVNGGVYENEIAGFGFRFDEYGLEEEPMGAYRDGTPAEEIAKNMLGTLVVELHCKNKELVDENGNDLVMMIVTVNVQESEDKVPDYLQKQLDRTLEQYRSGKEPFAGYSINGDSVFSGSIGGKEYEAYEISVNDSAFGTNIVKRVYFARFGQYIYRITIDASNSDESSSFDDLRRETDALISGYFYAL